MAIDTLNWDETPPGRCRDGAVTIGNFDGVHRGHASLLAVLRQQAEKGPAVAVTFDPHPLQLLRPERFQPVLTTVPDRAELLQASGADHVVILRTTSALLQLSAHQFFEQVLQKGLRARAIVEGPNFGFGRNREGNLETLRTLCVPAGIRCVVAPSHEQAGVRVSSSVVRGALVRGDVRQALALLGRPYRLRGTVGVGRRRGQSLGFPTANLDKVATLVPGDGVYAVRVQCRTGTWPGAANIGPNPTFKEQERKVEVHLIGFQGDLYDQVLAIDFIDRLRDTRPFASPAELIEQLQRDIERAGQLAGPS